MPELPEVETVVRGLRKTIRDKTIVKSIILHPKPLGDISPGQFKQFIKQQTIDQIKRFGKYIQIEFKGGKKLICHLRMTGKFIYRTVPVTKQELLKHIRLIFIFTDRSCLLFKDVRIFGTIKPYAAGIKPPELAALGVEPLSKKLTTDYLLKRAASRQISIKVLLLDQKVIAGLGNIYACEILFHAGINPLRPARALNRAQTTRLIEKIRYVIRLAIRFNGTSISDFRNIDNKRGEFQSRLQVYQKTGTRCTRCSQGTITRLIQSQRSTFYCPICQT